MPGHYLQLALSNRYPSTLRSLLSSGTFIEGWAVYAEQLMVDEGYNNNDPRQKLIALKWLLRSVTNAMMDQAIHCDGMTRDEAMRLDGRGRLPGRARGGAQVGSRAVDLDAAVDLLRGLPGARRSVRREVEEAWGDSSSRYGATTTTLLSFGSPAGPVRARADARRRDPAQ